MSRMCIYLPPFASDYSGACSALFDLDCLTVINDASCCTGHYVYYDEPRWNTKVKPLFCTSLRNIDAVLGNDEKIIDQICEVAGKIEAKMITVIGTPVPAITGMDIPGIASEIESRMGVPVFGFDTTGFDYYDRGIIKAGKTLIDRFAVNADPVKGRVNIVGATPLDFGNSGEVERIYKAVEASGAEIGTKFFMGMTAEQLENCASAELNIAVSYAGVELSKHLKKKFGTPYKAFVPADDETAEKIIRDGGNKILLVADQVRANSLRDRIEELDSTLRNRITVATFFGSDSETAREDDIHLRDEYSFIKLLKEGGYDTLTGDALLFDVPQCAALKKIALKHPAVSSFLNK